MSDANLKDKAEDDENAGFETLGVDAKVKKPVENESVEVKTKTPEEIKAEEDAAKLKAEADEAEKKRAEDEAPVVITKKQFDLIMAELDESKSLKKAFQSLTGTVGNLKTVTDDLKKTTATLEISAEDFTELEKEFPRIGEGVKKGLGALLKRMTGIRPAAGVGEDEMKAAIFQVHNAQQLEILEAEFGTDDKDQPVWRSIVGKPDNPTEYRKWFATQPEAWQKKVEGSYNAHVLIGAIKKYQRDVARAEKEEADRIKAAADLAARNPSGNGADRRRAAATPRGDGGNPPPSKDEQSEDDAFATAKRE